jgi:hypothetical protein
VRPSVQEFRLDDISHEVRLALCDLYKSTEFQGASCLREQVSFTLDCLRSDGLSISFSQIAVIFGGFEGTLIQHYQWSQTERRTMGRPMALNKTNWNHPRQFMTKRLATSSPPTTEDSSGLISSEKVQAFF